LDKNKVLFLCTGNSCRSQQAEAIINARMGDEWEAVSAGTKPTGTVHPKALRVLREIGIEHHISMPAIRRRLEALGLQPSRERG